MQIEYVLYRATSAWRRYSKREIRDLGYEISQVDGRKGVLLRG